jgi:hypothetical protein
VGAVKVGVAGVCEPRSAVGVPEGLRIGDAAKALERAEVALEGEGAMVHVAVVAMERGGALRLAERVPGFDVVVVGKPSDRGEGNDAPIPPVLVGKTLVVQAPNHLQAVALVDLYVRGGSDFKDGSGIERLERRTSIERRIAELQSRIDGWEKSKKISEADLAARRADLQKLQKEAAALDGHHKPPDGSYFTYALKDVRESFGTAPQVAATMEEYYRKVNRHNKEAFKDRKPEPAASGESHYLGVEDCSNCHEEAFEFWKKTPHARAYSTLTKQHKEFNLDCVSCHVTGYDRPGGSTVTHVEGLTSVQCEACHGPGSRHEDEPENDEFLTSQPPKTLCRLSPPAACR